MGLQSMADELVRILFACLFTLWENKLGFMI